MENFDLKKYLAENRLFEKKSPVWTIEGWDDSPNIESADEGYVEAVVNYIKSTHPDISNEDLKKSMEVAEETWYNEGRENAKSGDGEDFEVSVEEFADGAIEYYEDALTPDSGDGDEDDYEWPPANFPSIKKSFDHNLKFYLDNDPYLNRHMSPDVKAAFLNYAEKTLKPSNPSPDEIKDAIYKFYMKNQK